MNHYLNITLRPDAEMPSTILMNAIYTKLHKLLFDLQSHDIGVSFPKFNILLGDTLRIHGSEADLKKLHNQGWLGGMNGYCQIGEIKQVPANSKYRVISRKQTTMSQSKLRRLQKRGSIKDDDIKNYKAKMFTKGLSNPYIELVSASNGHKHRRYIEFGELQDCPIEGSFDFFGLSKTATVPWF